MPGQLLSLRNATRWSDTMNWEDSAALLRDRLQAGDVFTDPGFMQEVEMVSPETWGTGPELGNIGLDFGADAGDLSSFAADGFSLGGEAAGLGVESVEAGLSVGEVLGAVANWLGPIGMIAGIAMIVARFDPEDIKLGMEMGADFGFTSDAFDFGVGHRETPAPKEPSLEEIEQKLNTAYLGKDIYFFNYDYWWVGKIRDISIETQENQDEHAQFTIEYTLNRNQLATITTTDVSRIWLKDGRDLPGNFKSGYFVDAHISKFADEESSEDEYSLKYDNAGQLTPNRQDVVIRLFTGGELDLDYQYYQGVTYNFDANDEIIVDFVVNNEGYRKMFANKDVEKIDVTNTYYIDELETEEKDTILFKDQWRTVRKTVDNYTYFTDGTYVQDLVDSFFLRESPNVGVSSLPDQPFIEYKYYERQKYKYDSGFTLFPEEFQLGNRVFAPIKNKLDTDFAWRVVKNVNTTGHDAIVTWENDDISTLVLTDAYSIDLETYQQPEEIQKTEPKIQPEAIYKNRHVWYRKENAPEWIEVKLQPLEGQKSYVLVDLMGNPLDVEFQFQEKNVDLYKAGNFYEINNIYYEFSATEPDLETIKPVTTGPNPQIVDRSGCFFSGPTVFFLSLLFFL